MKSKPTLILPGRFLTNPVISVILPVYNGEEYLQLSVESVLGQTLENYEFLIIDDCSSDTSFEYLKNINDPRIRLFRNEKNSGLFFNLNFLIENSQSRLIKLWAQDDIMYPTCLQKFVDFHEKHTNIGFSYCNRDMIDEKGILRVINKEDNTPETISTELHSKIAYYTGSIAGNIANVCINKDALKKVGLFNENMKISGDFDMWVRLAEFYKTGFLKEKLIKLRDHEKQLSRKEEYYINHVKEDIEVYKNLDRYASPSVRREGKKLMIENKLCFYYTLMLKAGLKKNFTVFLQYWVLIGSYVNIYKLSFYFLKTKILGKKEFKI